jgi:hypothetical protein
MYQQAINSNCYQNLDAIEGTRKNFCNSSSVFFNNYNDLVCNSSVISTTQISNTNCVNVGTYSHKLLNCSDGTLFGGINFSFKKSLNYFLILILLILN